MPIYEYRCEACGAPKEAMQRMADAPLTVCDKCGEPSLQRVISKTSFHLKGSGWYVTDYKPASKEAKSESSSSESSPAPAAAAPAPKPSSE